MQVLGVAALARDQGALLGVVEVGEAGVVELEIRATELGHAPHLLGVRRSEVGPERLEVRVDGLDLSPPGRRGSGPCSARDGQLRHLRPLDHAAQELEAAPKIVWPRPIRSCTLSAAASKSRSPSLLWKCTASFWSVGSTPSSW